MIELLKRNYKWIFKNIFLLTTGAICCFAVAIGLIKGDLPESNVLIRNIEILVFTFSGLALFYIMLDETVKRAKIESGGVYD